MTQGMGVSHWMTPALYDFPINAEIEEWKAFLLGALSVLSGVEERQFSKGIEILLPEKQGKMIPGS